MTDPIENSSTTAARANTPAGMPSGNVVRRRRFDALWDLLFPPHCVACGRGGAWLCTACLGQVQELGSICPRCGVPMPQGRLCARCRSEPSNLSALRSVSAYTPPLREAIHALKYEGLRVLAQPLGHLLADYWRRRPLAAELVIPVPLHRARLRQRGYNQAVLLARAFTAEVGLPLSEKILVRERNTRSQVGLSREERQENVRGAFVCHVGDMRGVHILLIDDVLTSGATLNAAGQALLDAGAAEVCALTLARAVRTRRAARIGDRPDLENGAQENVATRSSAFLNALGEGSPGRDETLCDC